MLILNDVGFAFTHLDLHSLLECTFSMTLYSELLSNAQRMEHEYVANKTPHKTVDGHIEDYSTEACLEFKKTETEMYNMKLKTILTQAKL